MLLAHGRPLHATGLWRRGLHRGALRLRAAVAQPLGVRAPVARVPKRVDDARSASVADAPQNDTAAIGAGSTPQPLSYRIATALKLDKSDVEEALTTKSGGELVLPEDNLKWRLDLVHRATALKAEWGKDLQVANTKSLRRWLFQGGALLRLQFVLEQHAAGKDVTSYLKYSLGGLLEGKAQQRPLWGEMLDWLKTLPRAERQHVSSRQRSVSPARDGSSRSSSSSGTAGAGRQRVEFAAITSQVADVWREHVMLEPTDEGDHPNGSVDGSLSGSDEGESDPEDGAESDGSRAAPPSPTGIAAVPGAAGGTGASSGQGPWLPLEVHAKLSWELGSKAATAPRRPKGTAAAPSNVAVYDSCALSVGEAPAAATTLTPGSVLRIALPAARPPAARAARGKGTRSKGSAKPASAQQREGGPEDETSAGTASSVPSDGKSSSAPSASSSSTSSASPAVSSSTGSTSAGARGEDQDATAFDEAVVMVQCLFTRTGEDGVERQYMQVRTVLHGRDTMLGDVAAPHELFLLDYSPDHAAAEAREWDRAVLHAARFPNAPRRPPHWDVMREVPLDAVVGAEVLAVRFQSRPCDLAHREGNRQEDQQLASDNAVAAAQGLPPTYVARHVYAPALGMYRPLRVGELGLGGYVQVPPVAPPLELLPGGAGVALSGVQYKVGDFMYLDPSVLDSTKVVDPAQAQEQQEAAAVTSADRSRFNRPHAVAPWLVVQLLGVEAAGAAQQSQPQLQAQPQPPQEQQASTGQEPALLLKVRRLYRPEDAPSDTPYSGGLRDLYAPPGYGTAGAAQAAAGAAAGAAAAAAPSSEERPWTLRVHPASVRGKCAVRGGGETAPAEQADDNGRDTFVVVGTFDPSTGKVERMQQPPAPPTPGGDGDGAAAAAGAAATKPQRGRPPKGSTPLRALELFAGCGGLSEGLHQAGAVDTRWAIEWNREAAASFAENHRTATVFDMNCSHLLHVAAQASGQPGLKQDCILGGPNEEAQAHAWEALLAAAGPDGSLPADAAATAPALSALRSELEDMWRARRGLPKDAPVRDEVARQQAEEAVRLLRKLPVPGRPGDEVDIIIGGPPCQGYSGLNRHPKSQGAQLNRSLTRTFLSYCDVYRPRYFLLENVKGLVVYDKGKHFRLAVRTLLDMGYQVRFGVLDAANYGVPQSRLRTFIWAAQPEEVLPDWPAPLHAFAANGTGVKMGNAKCEYRAATRGSAPLRAVTVHDAISDLPAVDNGASDVEMDYACPPQTAYQRAMRGAPGSTRCGDHIVRALPQVDVDRIRHIPPNTPDANWLILKQLAEQDPSKAHLCPRITSVKMLPYSRLQWDSNFATVHTNPRPGNDSGGRVVHPAQHRIVSVRECARAQGFPDSFRFLPAGDIDAGYRQVGNAVPPPLARALGEELAKALQRRAKGAPAAAASAKGAPAAAAPAKGAPAAAAPVRPRVRRAPEA